MKILDIGCGKKKRNGAVGIDFHPETDADIIHDLNKLPYHFSDNEFDMIIGDNVIEHLTNPLKVMEEIHRIAKPDAIVKIMVPHFSSCGAFFDLTHKSFFSIRSFDIFLEGGPFPYYTKVRFRLLKSKIHFGRLYRLLGIEFIANRSPLFYETHLAFVFQAFQLYFELRVIK